MNGSILDHLCGMGSGFYERGYSFGSTGDLSVRGGEEVWIMPTCKLLKGLTPEQLSCADLDGTSLDENRPPQELPFRLGVYRARADAAAAVRLHSTHSVALSCLESLDAGRPPSPITPRY